MSEFAQYRSVDIIGVIKDLDQPVTIKIKARGDFGSQSEKEKRALTLVDDSNFSIQVTLWGFHAHNEQLETGKVIAIKNAKVSNYNSKSISAGDDNSLIYFDDKINNDRVLQLKKWWSKQSSNQ